VVYAGEIVQITSATSNIFLNCMFAFTLTVISTRRRSRREHSRLQHWLVSTVIADEGRRTCTGMVNDEIKFWLRIFWFS